MYQIKILFLAGLTVLFSPASDLARGEEGGLLVAETSVLASEGANDICQGFCEFAAEHGADAELEEARSYLLATARPGGTMVRQGPDLAIERLHPEFAKRLAAAIREVRSAGFTEAGIFSAYRPPAFGVGGFSNKFYSLHAYGLAVDMFGIGAAGSLQAKVWHDTAARHGIVCPYGYRNRVEWNHCQPTQLEAVRSDNPLRETITGAGPVDLARMFKAGDQLIADPETASASLVENGPLPGFNPTPDRHVSFSGRSARIEQTRLPTFAIREVIANRGGNKITSGGTRLVSNTPTLTRGKVVMMDKRPK